MDTATRRLLKIGVLAGSFLVAACQTAKLTDLKPGERPNIQSTEAGLWLQADRMEQRVQRQGNLIRDPELHRYLHGIICRLSAEHCPQIRVYIVERAGFNASMTPNGMMIVQSGLMLRTQNEAQLAYVLGHEMAHYIRRHTLQRWQTVKESAGFMMIVGLALGASGFGSASPVVNAAVVGGIFANNRENEREADRLGLEMLAKAGYAPDQASKVWSNLIAEKDAMAENDSGRSFFATHPDEGERKEKLTQLAAALPPAKSKPTVNKKPFIKAIDRHKSRWLEKELRLGKFDRTTVLLDLLK
ncbi:MAG TPA: hypothetical protein DCE33_12155, partial [Rhodospirillaceae bacterium]|nr:hypothetical protein [Rhodospirillaceae bacterium]